MESRATVPTPTLPVKLPVLRSAIPFFNAQAEGSFQRWVDWKGGGVRGVT